MMAKSPAPLSDLGGSQPGAGRLDQTFDAGEPEIGIIATQSPDEELRWRRSTTSREARCRRRGTLPLQKRRAPAKGDTTRVERENAKTNPSPSGKASSVRNPGSSIKSGSGWKDDRDFSTWLIDQGRVGGQTSQTAISPGVGVGASIKLPPGKLPPGQSATNPPTARTTPRTTIPQKNPAT